MIRGVYKFDNAALEIVKSVTKIKPQPWMHIAFADTLRDYVIYIWDTRQVLEEGHVDKLRRNAYLDMKTFKADYGLVTAKDNHKPLKGVKGKQFVFRSAPLTFKKGTWRNRPAYILHVGNGIDETEYVICQSSGFNGGYDCYKDNKWLVERRTLNEARRWMTEYIKDRYHM